MAANANIPQSSSAAEKIQQAATYDRSKAQVSYDPNVDYQARINEAVKQGDMTTAGMLERQRNAKIAATGSTQQQTNNYQQYLENGAKASDATYYNRDTDYQAEINAAKAAGDMTTASLLERQRNAKISGEGIANQQQTKDYAQYQPGAAKSYGGTAYNTELDYMAGITEAVQRGDLETARRLEQQRNAKIDGEGLNYEKTNLFGSAAQEPAQDSGASMGGDRYSDVVQNPSAMYEQMLNQLNEWRKAAEEQAKNKRDYATDQGVNELQRAMEDAQAEFQTQRDQVSADERKAMDNAALYAEARGDRGGIGQEQYNLIQSSAAQNRLAVSQAQTKLSTDTARQIADLRAQGEFGKADDLLSLAQTYLSQLTQLQQWQAGYAMDYAQFQEALRQWEAEYELNKAQLMGTLNGESTLAGKQFDESQRQWQSEFDLNKSQISQSEKEWQAKIGMTLLDAGILPSDAQLGAIGMTKAQAQDYITAQKLQSSATTESKTTGSSGGGGGSTSKSNGGSFTGSTRDAAISYMTKNGVSADDASRVMTESEWKRRKSSYNNWGQGTSTVGKYGQYSYDVSENATYQEYLKWYVQYMTA